MVNDKAKYFIFNGKKSSDFGVWCSGSGAMTKPLKRFERVEVPGRNGDLIIEDGSYENVNLEFKGSFIPEDFPNAYRDLTNYLYRQKGYKRLELSWLPDEYRMAAFEGDIDATVKGWNGFGSFDLAFDCKPQRFLKSGEEPIMLVAPFSAAASLTTPKFEASTSEIEIDVKALRLPASGVTITARFYENGSSTVTDTMDVEIDEVGMSAGFFLPTTANTSWDIMFELKNTSESLDDMLYEISGEIILDGVSQHLTTLFGRTIQVQNPTGFRSRPLIHVQSGFPISYVTTGETIDEGEQWSMSLNLDSGMTYDEFWMDCENEYIYTVEDGNKINLTNYITIVHYGEDGEQKAMSFPAMGEEVTTIYMASGGLVYFYPRWYRI